jgi:hypothetical protein
MGWTTKASRVAVFVRHLASIDIMFRRRDGSGVKIDLRVSECCLCIIQGGLHGDDASRDRQSDPGIDRGRDARNGGKGNAGDNMPGSGVGRFGRMFEDATDRPFHDDGLLLALAQLMTGNGNPADKDIDDGKPIRDNPPSNPDAKASDLGDENKFIPAGYTYFGQFVDHDITLDPTAFHGKEVDPEAMEDFRTPALDLDSVYGAGPDSQPYLYRFDARP